MVSQTQFISRLSNNVKDVVVPVFLTVVKPASTRPEHGAETKEDDWGRNVVSSSSLWPLGLGYLDH